MKNYISDKRHPRRETNKLLLDVYINMRDTETKVFFETIIENDGMDQQTLKEMIGQERDGDPWTTPGIIRLNPTSKDCINHWRNLWECMSRIALQRELNLKDLELRMLQLPCTSLSHFTRRKKDQHLEEAIANFTLAWANAESDCINAGAEYLLPHKLKRKSPPRSLVESHRTIHAGETQDILLLIQHQLRVV